VTALALTGIRGESVGLDESYLGPAAWQDLVGHLPGLEAVPAAEHLAEARRVKSPYEIECLDRALRIAEEALDVVIQALERGMTERDAAMLYTGEIVKRGASPLRAVVAMGDRTWIPAPRPTDRALRSGDLVRFDVGAVHRGYCGSVARTAVFGEPTRQAERAYLALQAGLEAASDAVRPGASAGHIVETATRAIMAEGLPRDACRLLGHGIGLASHERPELVASGVAIIEAGEILCVEAPYYDIGSMGLAVRDTLLITSAGARAMNRSRHDLVVLD
jgi:Xaa-Pro aminopeptidase